MATIWTLLVVGAVALANNLGGAGFQDMGLTGKDTFGVSFYASFGVYWLVGLVLIILVQHLLFQLLERRHRALCHLDKELNDQLLINHLASGFLKRPVELNAEFMEAALKQLGSWAQADETSAVLFLDDDGMGSMERQWHWRRAQGFQKVTTSARCREFLARNPKLSTANPSGFFHYSSRIDESGEPILLCGGKPFHEVLVYPLRRSGEALGLLCIRALRDKIPWNEDNLRVMARIAEVFAAALDQRLGYAEMEENRVKAQLALEGAEMGLWNVNLKTGEFYADEGWLRILGYKSGELDLRPGVTTEMIHPDDLEPFFSEYMKLVRGDTDRLCFELRIKNKAGQYIWVLSNGRILSRDAEGNPERLAGTQVDITAQKQEEANRLEMMKQRHALEQAKSLEQMAGGVAHDFNNVLAAILGSAELSLGLVKPGHPSIPLLKEVVNQVRRASKLTRKISTFASQTKPRYEHYDLSAQVRSLCESARSKLKGGSTLTCEISEHPLMIEADSENLEQVILNLLENASDALTQEQGRIHVFLGSCVMELEDKGVTDHAVNGPQFLPGLRLVVEDTGEGMSQQTLARLYDPFFSTRFPGRGMGMALVKGLIERHGGKVSAWSVLHEGSRITVEIPQVAFPRKEPAPIEAQES